jgi:hypothetical protein
MLVNTAAPSASDAISDGDQSLKIEEDVTDVLGNDNQNVVTLLNDTTAQMQISHDSDDLRQNWTKDGIVIWRHERTFNAYDELSIPALTPGTGRFQIKSDFSSATSGEVTVDLEMASTDTFVGGPSGAGRVRFIADEPHGFVELEAAASGGFGSSPGVLMRFGTDLEDVDWGAATPTRTNVLWLVKDKNGDTPLLGLGNDGKLYNRASLYVESDFPTDGLYIDNVNVVVQRQAAVADAAVVTTVGANTGTAGAGLSLIGDTSSSDQSAAIMNDFVALQEDILDIRTQLNDLLAKRS